MCLTPTAVTTTILVFQFELPPGFYPADAYVEYSIVKGRGTALSNRGYISLSLSLSLSLSAQWPYGVKL